MSISSERKERDYNWIRFWQPWEAEQQAVPATRYLPEMESEWEHRYRSLKTLDQLEDVPCLVLLGEPGIGNSRVVKKEIERLNNLKIQAHYHDLKSFIDANRIVDKIFQECSLTNGAHFLDSLDEGMAVVGRLANILVHHLREAEQNNIEFSDIRFRIVCRSTEWPASTMEELKTIFPDQKAQVWHLCQLRRSDVELAASHPHWEQKMPAAFVAEVEARGAVAFAIKPVTLDLLLQVKKEDGTLPNRQADLYRQGLLKLCLDPSDWRREQGFHTTSPPERRFALACWIAALSMLCQKPFIERIQESGLKSKNLLTRQDICAESQYEDRYKNSLDSIEKDLNEVLSSGLFLGIGGRVTWAHQTYMEFLAADYLAVRDLLPVQIEGLILAPGDRQKRVAPQMHELAAWLATIDEAWRRRLMANNPDLLLRSDVSAGDEAERLKLAESYLQALNDKQIEEADHSLYPRLAAPGLADVLRPFISNQSRFYLARLAAVKIAGQCRCTDLVNDLTALALCPDEDLVLRESAMSCLEPMADSDQLSRLLPLLEDQSDDIRGTAITLLWPGIATTEQALSALRPPQDKGVISHYNLLIRGDFLKILPENDLPVALRWIAGIIDHYPESYNDQRLWDFEELAPYIYAHAITRCNRPEVADALTDLIFAMVRNLNWMHPASQDGQKNLRSVPADDVVRRDLIGRILHRGLEESGLFVILPNSLSLVRADDVFWLIETLAKEEEPKVRNVIAKLIRQIVDQSDEEAMTQVWQARQYHADLQRATTDLFGPWLIEGKEANEQRELWMLMNGRSSEKTICKNVDSPDRINEVCRIYLDRLAAGDANEWWRMIVYLSIDNSNNLSGKCLDSGMSSLWRWQFLTEPTRARFVEGAIKYLHDGDIPNEEWWNTPNTLDFSVLAGYRALEHLAEYSLENLDDLSSALWSKWIPVLVAYPLNETQGVSLRSRLMQIALSKAPDTLLSWLRKILLAQVDQGRPGLLYEHLLKGVWSEEIGQLVAESLSRPGISLSALESGFRLALRHHHPFALSMWDDALTGVIQGKRRSTILLATLTYDIKAYWPSIWEVISQDRTLAREIILGIQVEIFSLRSLPHENLADLYILIKEIEASENSVSDDEASVNLPLDFLSGQIASVMIEAATPEALAGLDRLRQTGFDWADRAFIRACENKRRQDWSPPKPCDVLAMAKSREKRFVSSGSELLALVIESLERFQAELRGSPPQRHILWNTIKDNYRPKEENEISDVIAAHLRRDLVGRGIVTNREVQIQPPKPKECGERGERTDIHIDAVTRGSPADTITVVVEVKGCWHTEVKTAMRTQLVERYLDHNNIQHGLYLVGWFLCPVWNEKDSRRSTTQALPWEDLQAAKSALDEQAVSLSGAEREVRVFVLDVCWPGNSLPKEKKKNVKN